MLLTCCQPPSYTSRIERNIGNAPLEWLHTARWKSFSPRGRGAWTPSIPDKRGRDRPPSWIQRRYPPGPAVGAPEKNTHHRPDLPPFLPIIHFADKGQVRDPPHHHRGSTLRALKQCFLGPRALKLVPASWGRLARPVPREIVLTAAMFCASDRRDVPCMCFAFPPALLTWRDPG